MKTYRFTSDYASGIGAWKTGDTADFDDVTAAWLLRDVAGVIEPVEDEDGERKQAPRQNRQVTKAQNRGAA
jgi:hypothetical protein